MPGIFLLMFEKHDKEKPHIAYIPTRPLEEVARALDHGAKKYGRDNFKSCPSRMQYISAAMRHIYAWIRREDIDPETGISHLAHAIASLIIARDNQIDDIGRDDRP